MNPGKYDNISLEEYHKLPAWSKTALDKINRSPAHYLEYLANPPEQTPAMAFGSALHCAVLTPELYQKQYAVSPLCDRRTKIGKETLEAFLKESEGKSVVTSDAAGQIERMKKAIFEHPLASQILTNGEAEQSFFWTDPKTNLECKARPDYYRNDGIVVDLKTCADATFKEFQRAVYNFRYHVQGAFFMDGIFQATGKPCSDFVLIAVEKEAPFGIMVYRLDDLAIDAGRLSYQDNLLEIKQWKEHPEAYKTVYQLSTNPVEMCLPAWAE
jgi:exodeoxyribonuclease VIII